MKNVTLLKTMMFSTIIALTQPSDVSAMDTDINENEGRNSLSILTVEEFGKRMTENGFLKTISKSEDLTLTEKEQWGITQVTRENTEKKLHIVEDNIKRFEEKVSSPSCSTDDVEALVSLKKLSVTYEMKANRKIEDFKGDTLVIGGGRKESGITNIQVLDEEIFDIPRFKFNVDTGEKLNEESRQHLLNEKQQERQHIIDNYYTINYSQDVDPDLVGSATDVNLLKILPKNRFKTIYYENVDNWIFLNPATLQIAQELCEPGGTIKISTGFNGARLLLIALEDMPNTVDALKQLKNNYDTFKQDGRIQLEWKNNK
jgi:hypothetical protein